jgi:hypothetical protein
MAYVDTGRSAVSIGSTSATSAAAVIGPAVLALAQLRHLRPGAEPNPGSAMEEAANGRADTRPNEE